MSVKFSTGLPNCREGRQNLIGSVTPVTIRKTATLAEELGYYSLWPNEFHTTFPGVAKQYEDPPTLFDVTVTMATVAAITERIRITPSTIVLPLYEPIMLSRQLATLDHFSDGRVTLGIGLGGSADEYRQLRGLMEKPNRGRMMDEYLEALNVLWTERQATYHGRYVHFTDVETHPKPVQQPLPIFMAGHAEGVFRRLAKYGHGWIDSSELPESIESNVKRLKQYAEEAGRGDVQFQVSRQFYTSIAETEEEAKANHAKSVPPPNRAQPVAAAAGRAAPDHPQERNLIGTPDFIVGRLKEYVAAGVSEICVIFFSPDDESVERQLKLFAEEVMPKL